jgi:hypothetical protein
MESYRGLYNFYRNDKRKPPSTERDVNKKRWSGWYPLPPVLTSEVSPYFVRKPKRRPSFGVRIIKRT